LILKMLRTENAANISFLKMLGLEPDKNLVYSQADTVEDVFNIIETIIKTVRKNDRNKLITIVWDSIAGTSTRKEMEEDVGNVQVAMVPRLLGQGLRKVIRQIGDQRIALIFLNQLRSKIGMVFGDPMTPPGGNAVPFFADVRLRLLTAGKIKAGNDIIGVGTKAKVVKTRFGPPFRECIFNIYFDKGIVDEESWITYLKSKKLIRKEKEKSPISFIKLDDDAEEFSFRDKEFAKFIKKHPELSAKIKKMIKLDMYIDQNPDNRDEDIVLEEINEDEISSL